MEPTKKSYSLDAALDAFLGASRTQTIRENNCVICAKPATQFRDQLSIKEYTISGMCQNCQDEAFKE